MCISLFPTGISIWIWHTTVGSLLFSVIFMICFRKWNAYCYHNRLWFTELWCIRSVALSDRTIFACVKFWTGFQINAKVFTTSNALHFNSTAVHICWALELTFYFKKNDVSCANNFFNLFVFFSVLQLAFTFHFYNCLNENTWNGNFYLCLKCLRAIHITN